MPPDSPLQAVPLPAVHIGVFEHSIQPSASTLLHLDHETSGKMPELDAGRCLVDLLPTGTLAPDERLFEFRFFDAAFLHAFFKVESFLLWDAEVEHETATNNSPSIYDGIRWITATTLCIGRLPNDVHINRSVDSWNRTIYHRGMPILFRRRNRVK